MFSTRDRLAALSIILMFGGVWVLPSSRLGFVPLIGGALVMFAVILLAIIRPS